MESGKVKRKAMFEKVELQRDDKSIGFVTRRKFWKWTLEHTGHDGRAVGKGHKK